LYKWYSRAIQASRADGGGEGSGRDVVGKEGEEGEE